MDKPYIIHCELSLEQVTLLRDLLYMHEDITAMRGDDKATDLAVSLSYAIESGCALKPEYRKEQNNEAH